MNPSALNRGEPEPEERASAAPLDRLFCDQFRSWVEHGSSGPRTPGLEAAWKCAILAPARCVLGERGKQFRARLTRAAWGLAGGSLDAMPATLPWIVEALHAGSLVVDDIQDESDSRRGQPTLHKLIGVPLAINTGNLLYCWAQDLLTQIGFEPAIELALHRRITRTMLRCHQGQGLDLSVRICETPQHLVPSLVQTSTSLKAGELLQLAAVLGAIGAGGDEERVAAIAEFGNQLGVALQMLDDLSGVLNPHRRHKAVEDLSLQRPTWNWAWMARDLDPAEYQRVQAEASRADGPEAMHAVLDGIAVRVRGCKERVHSHLTVAMRELRSSCGDPPLLKLLEAEIERLESSYV